MPSGSSGLGGTGLALASSEAGRRPPVLFRNQESSSTELYMCQLRILIPRVDCWQYYVRSSSYMMFKHSQYKVQHALVGLEAVSLGEFVK